MNALRLALAVIVCLFAGSAVPGTQQLLPKAGTYIYVAKKHLYKEQPVCIEITLVQTPSGEFTVSGRCNFYRGHRAALRVSSMPETDWHISLISGRMTRGGELTAQISWDSDKNDAVPLNGLWSPKDGGIMLTKNKEEIVNGPILTPQAPTNFAGYWIGESRWTLSQTGTDIKGETRSKTAIKGTVFGPVMLLIVFQPDGSAVPCVCRMEDIEMICRWWDDDAKSGTWRFNR